VVDRSKAARERVRACVRACAWILVFILVRVGGKGLIGYTHRRVYKNARGFFFFFFFSNTLFSVRIVFNNRLWSRWKTENRYRHERRTPATETTRFHLPHNNNTRRALASSLTNRRARAVAVVVVVLAPRRSLLRCFDLGRPVPSHTIIVIVFFLLIYYCNYYITARLHKRLSSYEFFFFLHRIYYIIIIINISIHPK
jgi:hypothetical protein